MEIRNDELYDDLDDLDNMSLEEPVNKPSQVDPEPEPEPDLDLGPTGEDGGNQDDDFITTLLKSRGIYDKSKIKFEDGEGSVAEYNWDDLSNDEKLNIVYSSQQDPDTDLDDAEAQLINAIRQSGLTPAEYLEHLQEEGVNSYIQNNQDAGYQYQVDQYSDDELFIFDFMSRMRDVTDEEAQDALEKAKSNETLYAKQVAALRNEYKAIEDGNNRQAQFELEEQERERYNQFAEQVADQIGDFNEFSGYDLNLSDEDRDDLYEFITGVDGAGNNYFAKALSDPQILVQTAWLALNGKQMMEDITNYFQNEIKQVRKESYEKGLEDAKNGKKKAPVVFKDKQPGAADDVYDDLDNF